LFIIDHPNEEILGGEKCMLTVYVLKSWVSV